MAATNRIIVTRISNGQKDHLIEEIVNAIFAISGEKFGRLDIM